MEHTPETLYEREVSRLIFHNANKNTEVRATEPTEHRVNSFVGRDPSQWKTDIQTSKTILYKNIYRNIDLNIFGREKEIEIDWILKPGGKVDDICFEYKDVIKTGLDQEGNLLIVTRFGEILHRKPVSYQMIKERKIIIDSGFRRIQGNTYGFTTKAFDVNYPLIIDPVILVYSTYLGGNREDKSQGIAVDGTGAAYVTGYTFSSNFPKKLPYDGTCNAVDVFVTKFTPAGTALSYSTYIGGTGSDRGQAIAVDSTGAVYVAGYTTSSDFPTQNPYDNTLNSAGVSDAFVTKLSVLGNALFYSTYLGGIGSDVAQGIAVDSKGSAYLTGYTESTDFPKKSAYDGTLGGLRDAFVAKFGPAGNTLSYSTLLGGNSQDSGYAIAVDRLGFAYVTGETLSSDFPKINAFDNSLGGGRDAFVTKLGSAGNVLKYSTYLGGSGANECGQGIAVDALGAAYIAGRTDSSDFPVKNAYDPTFNGGVDVFLVKVASTGKTLNYSTYLGGSAADEAGGIAVNSSKEAYVTGYTFSSNFPTLNAFDPTFNGSQSDAFVTKFTAAGNTLAYSTFLGGTGADSAHGIALDNVGAAYITGSTSSVNFPKKAAYDPGYNTNGDAFVTKLDLKAAGRAMWLQYWSGDQPARLNLGVQYYSVRFTKPAGWNNLSIGKVKIVFASSGQSITLCFWRDYQQKSGDYYPSGAPAKGRTATISYGSNSWDTSASNWTTNKNEFFIGFEQASGFAILAGDGKCKPENRSFRMYKGQSWEKEYGMFANYCISIYVIEK